MKQELMKKTSYKTNNTFMGLIKFMFIMFTFIFMGVFLNNNPKIKLANEKTYIKVSKEKGVVYLMMSSKDVSEVKEKILRYKGD